MRLVVGLGNPGPEYEDTRHNVGFRVVERLAARASAPLAREKSLRARFGEARIAGHRVGLLLPETWMNRSGDAVLRALEVHPLDPATDLLVVYDDLDLPFGRLRLRPSGGAGGHNGLADVSDRLGRTDFARLRVGIGRPPEHVAVIDWVLTPWSDSEAASLAGITDRASDAIELWLSEGVSRAMNRVNAAPPAEPEA